MPEANTSVNVMEQLVSLCKRRGFIYPASEIYGGFNGFWDYGPLGVLLKNTIRDWWWRCMVESAPIDPDGHPVDIVGLDSSIIQNPKTWLASGHVGGFSDPMVDDKETKQRFRADHLWGAWRVKENPENEGAWQEVNVAAILNLDAYQPQASMVGASVGEAAETFLASICKALRLEPIEGRVEDLFDTGSGTAAVIVRNKKEKLRKEVWAIKRVPIESLNSKPETIPSPFTQKPGQLTQPRQFNLMFETYVGALQDETAKAYLRPETAQGIFLNFKNVVDTTRVKVPFGVAQIGKSFRNEVTPRNFIFRSREFEQMEMEWFCHPDEAVKWYEFWRTQRMNWWHSLGIKPENLRFRDHSKEELAFYSKATVDIEYKYPFTAPDFGELEGIAHRGDYDLTQHAKHSGQKLDYFDQDLQLKLKEQGVSAEEIKAKSRYVPNVIEPASGLTRAVLVLLCEGYRREPGRQGAEEYLSIKPRFAPIKCGVFPLVNKDGMPEVAEKLYLDLRKHFTCEYDAKQAIGRRYARMDEIGTPFAVTIDGETLKDQTVTIRERDTMHQERIALDQVANYLRDRLER
jgi:glycyl-tRNA synthetase